MLRRRAQASLRARASSGIRAGAVVALALAAWSLATPPALAHAALDSITPADGTVLQEPPAQIELVFNERLLEASVKVVVSDGSGDVVIRDRSVVSDSTVSVPWNPDLPGDSYTIAYRVVSGDGHPITGQSTFTLDIPPITSTTAQGSSMPITPAPSAPRPSSTPTQPTLVAESPAPINESVFSTDWRVIAAIILGTVGGVAIVLWQRRRTA
jgi:methionine-rich copper-binding protein CopC